MGIMGGGGGGGAAAVPPVKAVPPPAQLSASLAAVRNAKQAVPAGDLGGTILTDGGGLDVGQMRSPGDVMYGKKLTGG